MNTVLKTAAFAVCLASVPAAAWAGGPKDLVAVSYADLNLATDKGTRILDRRIDNAIETVCGGPAPRELRMGMKVRRCIAKAKTDVANQRDLAIREYRENRLAARDRVIRFVAR